MQLTEEQLEIVHHQQGHALISAVAGSGKTTAMVARASHLLDNGVEADKIMALMFNRSARQAFVKKLSLAIKFGHQPRILTFHALGLRLTDTELFDCFPCPVRIGLIRRIRFIVTLSDYGKNRYPCHQLR